MPESTPRSKPELIAYPGDNAEFPAKVLEADIYVNAQLYKNALALGSIVLWDIHTNAQGEPTEDQELIEHKKVIARSLKDILADDKLVKSIWFDDDSETALSGDEKYAGLLKKNPRSQETVEQMRFQRYVFFVDHVISWQEQVAAEKTKLGADLRRVV